jgi:uncharacterized phage protein (TIGR02218 family)
LKPWSDGLKALYAQTVSRFASFWKVTRSDGQVFGFVDHDQDVTIAGVTYRAAEGLGTTAAQATADLQPGTMDVSAFLEVSTEGEMEAGLWDEAAITAFEAPWDAPPATLDPTQANILTHGHLGQITRQTGRFTAQLHGMTEQLDTAIGRMYLPGCPWRLGDSRCQVNLAEWTRTGTVTGVGADARYVFSDTGQGEEAGWFAEGVITMTSGVNVGRSMDIRLWEPPTFTMHRPLPYPVAVGDTYSAVTGDDKTGTTCVVKFNNFNRFGGFPYLPGPDAVMQNPLVIPENQKDVTP